MKITYSNELEEASKLMPGTSKAQLKQMGLKDEVTANGVHGQTLLPGGEKDPNGDGRGSTNGNIKVFISADLTDRDAARTEAHEGNGHALFFVQGKNPNHGENREVDNPELETQIRERVTEAETNYDNEKKKSND